MGTKKLTELIFDVVCLLAGVILFISAQMIETGTTMGQGADFIPKLCTALWIVAALGQLHRTMRMEDDHRQGSFVNRKSFLCTVLLLIGYVCLLPALGFVISSALYLMLQMLLFVPTVYRTRKTILLFFVLSLLTPILTYLLFVNVFGLLLPSGMLFG